MLVGGGLVAAMIAVGGELLAPVAANAAWGGYQNGYIPTSALSSIPWRSDLLLRADATNALVAMNAAHRAARSSDIGLSDAYRTYAKQVEARNYWCAQGNCGNAAEPGTSNHGWALAIDVAVGIHDWNAPLYVWLKANAGAYGWTHPSWAEPSGAHPEAWHWEFTGSYNPPATGGNSSKENDMFVAALPWGWYLVVPQGSAKARGVILGGDSGAGNAGLPIITFTNESSIAGLRAAVDGI